VTCPSHRAAAMLRLSQTEGRFRCLSFRACDKMALANFAKTRYSVTTAESCWLIWPSFLTLDRAGNRLVLVGVCVHWTVNVGPLQTPRVHRCARYVNKRFLHTLLDMGTVWPKAEETATDASTRPRRATGEAQAHRYRCRFCCSGRNSQLPPSGKSMPATSRKRNLSLTLWRHDQGDEPYRFDLGVSTRNDTPRRGRLRSRAFFYASVPLWAGRGRGPSAADVGATNGACVCLGGSGAVLLPSNSRCQ